MPKVIITTGFVPFHAGYVSELDDDDVFIFVQLIQIEKDEIGSHCGRGIQMYKGRLSAVLKVARESRFSHVGGTQKAETNLQRGFVVPFGGRTARTDVERKKSIGRALFLLLIAIFFDGTFQIEVMYKTTVTQGSIGHGRGIVIAQPSLQGVQFVRVALGERGRSRDRSSRRSTYVFNE